MKAEIGFVVDNNGMVTERMQLRIEAQSETETTLIAVLAKRLEMKAGIYGELYITEPER